MFLGAQCTDHWTTGQSRGVGVRAVQLTMHVKSSTLYGRTSKFFQLDGLLLLCIIMGLLLFILIALNTLAQAFINPWRFLPMLIPKPNNDIRNWSQDM